jgi:hypothetical protein
MQQRVSAWALPTVQQPESGRSCIMLSQPSVTAPHRARLVRVILLLLVAFLPGYSSECIQCCCLLCTQGMILAAALYTYSNSTANFVGDQQEASKKWSHLTPSYEANARVRSVCAQRSAALDLSA